MCVYIYMYMDMYVCMYVCTEAQIQILITAVHPHMQHAQKVHLKFVDTYKHL